MAKQFARIEDNHKSFIARQRIFFTASAAEGTRVNISPRPTEALRLVDDLTAIYLDKTGSGNETAAHLLVDGRLTLMFCAFEGPPVILRLYGNGRMIRRGSAEYLALLDTHYGGEEPLGARQIIRLDIDLVQTSCGYGVPLFDYQGERCNLDRWAEAKGEDGLRAYWREKNLTSMDGLPTGLLDEEELVS
ncbi:pyridoxamine 5'-phosphate oxidase family protein [Taklimakanibacter deserti]|uniref:pyridoxamine 5'-phosphate oxidase family protein n=1 Tax=Taklimakanibacter deserti TaxID=2267839 RepID=UPI000E65E6EC